MFDTEGRPATAQDAAANPGINRPQLRTTAKRFEQNCAQLERMDARTWRNVEAALPDKIYSRARNSVSVRWFVEAVLWIADTDLHWKELPKEYGPFHTNYVRFGRWAQAGIWQSVVAALEDKPQLQHRLRLRVNSYTARYQAKQSRKLTRNNPHMG